MRAVAAIELAAQPGILGLEARVLLAQDPDGRVARVERVARRQRGRAWRREEAHCVEAVRVAVVVDRRGYAPCRRGRRGA